MKAVVSLSGGMDSTTVLGWMVDRLGAGSVDTVSFHYGSKHNSYELKAAAQVAQHYGVSHRVLDMEPLFRGLGLVSNLLEGQGDIPEGHYTDASMSQTVVPGRNIIFLSLLAGFAWSRGARQIGIGIHQGDHAIYADCRTEFFKAMDTALYLGTDRRVEIVAPFVDTDKLGILEWGTAHDVPYNVTRTCYKNQPISCGKCGSCVERLEAWDALGTPDPIPYDRG